MLAGSSPRDRTFTCHSVTSIHWVYLAAMVKILSSCSSAWTKSPAMLRHAASPCRPFISAKSCKTGETNRRQKRQCRMECRDREVRSLPQKLLRSYVSFQGAQKKKDALINASISSRHQDQPFREDCARPQLLYK